MHTSDCIQAKLHASDIRCADWSSVTSSPAVSLPMRDRCTSDIQGKRARKMDRNKDNASVKKTATEKSSKSKSPGCLTLLVMVVGIGLIGQCLDLIEGNQTIVISRPITPEEQIYLEEEVQEIRSYFESENCENFYRNLAERPAFNGVDKQVALEVCSKASQNHEDTTSIRLVESKCETTKNAEEPEENTLCLLQYKLNIGDEYSIDELFAWSLKEEAYTLVNIEYNSPNAS